MTRVLVTGIGIVSSLGRGAEATMQRLCAGERGIAPISLFEVEGLRSSIAAQCDVAGEEPGASRAEAMALTAAREALEQARIEAAGTALYVAGTTSGMRECELHLAKLARQPDHAVDLTQLRGHPLTAPADCVHRLHGPFAATKTVCAACSGGAVALWLAAAAIRAGRLERALAGGVDALCRLTYSGFAALGALDAAPCRPFDKSRAGLSLGEGAAFLVLESEASAAKRGAQAIAELAGWGAASEAHHITHPEPDGATAARVMGTALARGGLAPADLDYVNAHGTATPHNDPMEVAAMRRCLGAEFERVPISSVKGAIGHTLGAAGAIEAAVTALAVARGVIPPTAGLTDPDPECVANHVTTARRQRVRAALTNAFGFGGNDVALLFAEPGFARPASRRDSRRRVVVTGAATVGPLGAGGSLEALAYLEPGPPATETAAPLPEGALDPMKARRMERAARLFTVAAARALAESGAPAPSDTAIVAGSAWGSPEATGGFLVRLFEKGARFAGPAAFPGALPSSIASHASIYLGLRGAAFTTADLAVSAESALHIAAELVAAGDVDAVVCGSVDEKSETARRVAGPLHAGLPDRGRRGEGGGALVVEDLAAARARGARPIAELRSATSWRGAPLSVDPPPTQKAVVFLAREGIDVPASWSDRPRHALAPRAGDHESVGAIALAAAVGALESGAADHVLVLGAAPDRGYAFVLSTMRSSET